MDIVYERGNQNINTEDAEQDTKEHRAPNKKPAKSSGELGQEWLFDYRMIGPRTRSMLNEPFVRRSGLRMSRVTLLTGP